MIDRETRYKEALEQIVRVIPEPHYPVVSDKSRVDWYKTIINAMMNIANVALYGCIKTEKTDLSDPSFIIKS